MATTQKDTWLNMASKLKGMGGIRLASVGEPMSPPSEGLSAAIIPSGGSVPETVLNSWRETHTAIIRLYHKALGPDPDQVEYALDSARASIVEDIMGDFDLGGKVAYVLPVQTTWQYGYQDIGQTKYRLLDISISYRVDPTALTVA